MEGKKVGWKTAEALIDEERARRLASRATVAKAIAKRLGILEAERRDAMPKMGRAVIPQVKAGLCHEAAKVRAEANFSRMGHNVIKTETGKSHICTGCRMRRKKDYQRGLDQDRMSEAHQYQGSLDPECLG